MPVFIDEVTADIDDSPASAGPGRRLRQTASQEDGPEMVVFVARAQRHLERRMSRLAAG